MGFNCRRWLAAGAAGQQRSGALRPFYQLLVSLPPCAPIPQARMLLPGLPQVDAQVLSSAKTGIFANMLMGGGIGMDMLEVGVRGCVQPGFVA